MLHGAGIFTYIYPKKLPSFVGIIPYMEHMGYDIMGFSLCESASWQSKNLYKWWFQWKFIELTSRCSMAMEMMTRGCIIIIMYKMSLSYQYKYESHALLHISCHITGGSFHGSWLWAISPPGIGGLTRLIPCKNPGVN